MKQIQELIALFEDINERKGKAGMNTAQFCSELTESDSDEYLNLHFHLLSLNKRYFQPDLKMFFGFRQDRAKCHRFLKEKRTEITDENLRKDIEDILEDINYADLDELKQWLAAIESGKRTDKDRFVWSIMKSPFVAYHYELLKDRQDNMEWQLWRGLWARFDEHGEEGALFLLSKLDKGEDPSFHSEIIFMLGTIEGDHAHRTREHARQLTKHADDYTRERALIVLGWVGNSQDTSILEHHLLHDSHAKCRAWSASSFMQLWFKQPSVKLKKNAFQCFRKAIDTETDLFTLAVLIESIQEIGRKRFGITKTALEDLDATKIGQASGKAQRYLDKALKNG